MVNLYPLVRAVRSTVRARVEVDQKKDTNNRPSETRKRRKRRKMYTVDLSKDSNSRPHIARVKEGKY